MSLYLRILTILNVFFFLFVFSNTVSSAQDTTPSLTGLNYSQQKNIGYTLTDTLRKDKPPALSAKTITGQVVAGAFMGGLSGLIAGYLAMGAFQCSEHFLCELGEFFAGAVVGYTLGSSFIIYHIGNNFNRTASYPAVLLGNLIGLAAGASILNQLANNNTKSGKVIGGIALFGLPLAGSIIAYNITRRYPDQNITVVPSVINTSPLLKNRIAPAVSIRIKF